MVLSRSLHVVRSITVEPCFFLYMFAFELTSVAEETFYTYRACRVNLNYSEYICKNIEESAFQEQKDKVEVVVSNFLEYSNIVSYSVPFILAFFIGAWSDRRGRKLPLLVGLFGQIYFMAMLAVVSTQETWPLETVLAVVDFPAALTGGDLVIFASAFSYIADVSSTSQRTVRIAILEGVYLLAMPTGLALGSYLYSNVLDESFTAMFSINASLLTVSFFYALFRLEWLTTDSQKSLKGVNICKDFFDWHHVVESFRTIFRRRTGYRRLYIILIIFSLALYTFQRNESSMSYLYTQNKFSWTSTDFSNYKVWETSFYILGTLIGTPVLNKLCGIRDTGIVLIGAPSHALARIVYIFAQVPWLFYVGAAVSCLGPMMAPVLRSMASKLVPVEERGKIFAILEIADIAIPLVSSVIYTQVYDATVSSYPAAIYWVTFTTQALVFILMSFVHISMRKSQDI